MAVLGVDGWRGAWVGARLSGRTVTVSVLPDAGARACDRAAGRLLGRARSSVFPAPVRTVLAAADHADACARSRAASEKALPAQRIADGPAESVGDDTLDGRGRPMRISW